MFFWLSLPLRIFLSSLSVTLPCAKDSWLLPIYRGNCVCSLGLYSCLLIWFLTCDLGLAIYILIALSFETFFKIYALFFFFLTIQFQCFEWFLYSSWKTSEIAYLVKIKTLYAFIWFLCYLTFCVSLFFFLNYRLRIQVPCTSLWCSVI